MNPFLSTARRWILLLMVLPTAMASAQSTPPARDAKRFDVFEFQVVGNTTLDIERVERTVYPYLGEQKTIADVEAARAALEAAYRDAGFATIAVDIPEQKVVSGTVVLNVVEGKVARLRVIGSRYFSQDRIIAAVPALAEGAVPNLPEVQRQLAEVNSTLDKRVTPLLRPGKDVGTTDVDLQVEDQLPLHGSVELNNHNASGTTPARLQASLQYANLFQREHNLGVQIQTSPQDTKQVRVISGSYSMPVNGSLAVFSALRSVSRTFAGGGIGVFGTGDVFGARYVMPIQDPMQSKTLYHSLTLGFDYKTFQQNVSLTDGTGFGTPVRYAPLSLNYAGQLSDKTGVSEFGVGVSFVARGLWSNEQEFSDKRYLARSNYAVLKFNASRTENLSNHLVLYAHVDGQLSDEPLISNEQFVAGGADSVRGYMEATQTGDSALRATIELRSPNVMGGEATRSDLRLRAYFDGAYLHNFSPLPGSPSAYELASLGTGLTLEVKQGLTLKADLAFPLRTSGAQLADRLRLHASAAYAF